MKGKRFYLLFTALLIGLNLAKGQEQEVTNTPPQEEEREMTLAEQFDDMKRKSNSFQEYKVVKLEWLDTFWENVQDSIEVTKTALVNAQEEINGQITEINKLDEDLRDRESELAKSSYDIEHISVLGVDFRKGTYVVINYVIILLLIVLLAAAIFKFKQSNSLSVKKVNEYNSLEDEFKEYKLRAFEKETKLRRDMQTEMNRAEELKQKLANSKK